MGDELLNVTQVAQYLGTSRSTVYGWVSAGILKPFRLGKGPRRCLRFSRSDLDKWLQKSRQTHNPQDHIKS